MCCIKDLDEVRSELADTELALALAVYREICQLDLAEFVGRRVKVVGGASNPDETVLVFAFHELPDALAWAVRVQNALQSAQWPTSIDAINAASTIYYRESDDRWKRLCRGLRVSIAVTQQHLHIEAVTVCAAASSNGAAPRARSRRQRGDREAPRPIHRRPLLPFTTFLAWHRPYLFLPFRRRRQHLHCVLVVRLRLRS